MNGTIQLMKLWESRFARVALAMLIHSAALAVLPMGCRSKMAQAPPPSANPAPSPPVATGLHTPEGDLPTDIAFNDVSLLDAIPPLGKTAGLNVQIDPALLHQTAPDGTPIAPPHVTVKWTKVTALQAMDALLNNYGWRMEWKQNDLNVRIVPAASSKEVIKMTTVNLLEKAPTNNAGGDEKVDITFNGVSLLDAVPPLAFQAGLNIIFDPLLLNPQDVNHQPIPPPMLNLHWTKITCRQALQELMEQHGWQMTCIPGNPIIHIGPSNIRADELR
jgi:hypothetical protein